jgi:cytochrome c
MSVKHLLVLCAAIFIAACAQESSDPNEVTEPAATAAVVADPAEVAALVAAADPAMGKRLYIFCQACHTVNAGGQNKVGPNLSGVIGRAAGQADGFVYSAALAGSGVVWDVAALDSWIENPGKLVPGTTMIFGGIKDPQQRANLIAYLQQVTQP